MKEEAEHVEFENDKVRVLRIKVGAHEKQPVRTRGDRVLIWLTDTHHVRVEHEGGREGGSEGAREATHEELHRRAGDVAWRPASRHQVESKHHAPAELIIVELKR